MVDAEVVDGLSLMYLKKKPTKKCLFCEIFCLL